MLVLYVLFSILRATISVCRHLSNVVIVVKCGKLHEYTECHKRCPLPCTIIEYRRGVSYGGFPHLQYLEAIQRSHIDKVQPNRSKLNYRLVSYNIIFCFKIIPNCKRSVCGTVCVCVCPVKSSNSRMSFQIEYSHRV